jgi:hypothetical protein
MSEQLDIIKIRPKGDSPIFVDTKIGTVPKNPRDLALIRL